MQSLLNRHLYLLTGRCDNFVTPALNTGLRYGGDQPSAEVAEARKLLHLADTTTDFYVLGAMAALVAAGSTAGDDLSAVFLPRSLKIPPPSIVGGKLRPATAESPVILYRPTALPAARAWRISRVSATEVRITADSGYDQMATSHLAGGIVYVDWPVETGFSAAFAPPTWSGAEFVTVITEPSGYPYTSVAGSIRQSNSLIRLMAAEGTLSAFHASQSSLQKVGALVAAVIRRGDEFVACTGLSFAPPAVPEHLPPGPFKTRQDIR